MVLVILVASAFALPIDAALTLGEKNAITKLLSIYPNLNLVDPTIPRNSVPGTYFNDSWSISSISSLCIEPDAGWQWFGIHCSPSGHIDAITCNDGWNSMNTTDLNFSSIGGLAFLTNFTIESSLQTYQTSCFQLLQGVLNYSIGLQSLSLSDRLDSLLPLTSISNHSSLISLDITFTVANDASKMTFTNLTNLQYLSLGFYSPPSASLSPLSPVSDTLLSLTISGGISDISLLPAFTSLQSFSMSLASVSGNLPLMPPSLKSMSITSIGSQSINITQPSSYNLNYVSIVGPASIKNITSMPKSVSTIFIAQCSGLKDLLFTSPEELTQLTLASLPKLISLPLRLEDSLNLTLLNIRASNSSIIQKIPSLNRTSLTSLEWSNMAIDDASLASSQLCTIAKKDLLTSIKMSFNSFSHLPSCLNDYYNLQILDVSFCGYFRNWTFISNVPRNLTTLNAFSLQIVGPIDWDGISNRLSNLQVLSISLVSSQDASFPDVDIWNRLTHLQQLSIDGNHLTGTMPHNFFASLPNLQTFTATQNELVGTIPWYGMENVTVLSLSNNQFTSWPSIIGNLSKLIRVDISDNALTQIPDDESFATMIQISDFSINSNPTLGGPLPQFWINHPTLKAFRAVTNGFSGPAISPGTKVSSPKLQVLSLSLNNLCGSLPEFNPGRLAYFSTLDFSYNQFTGPIPSSWGDNVAVTSVSLNANKLNGSIPNQIFAQVSKFLTTTIALKQNDLTGNPPNLFGYNRLGYLDLRDTSVATCSKNPNITSVILSNCDLSLTPEQGCSCPSWWPCNRHATCSPAPPGSPIASSPNTHVPQALQYCDYALGPRPGPPPIPQPPGTQPVIVPQSSPFWAPVSPTFEPQSQSEPIVIPETEPTLIPENNPIQNNPFDAVIPCPLPAPQGNFFCSNGAWVSNGSVTETNIVIPGDSTVIVNGNLTVTGTLTFTGLSTNLFVNGCVILQNGVDVVVTFTTEELEAILKSIGKNSLEKTLLISLYEGLCIESTDLSNAKVTSSSGSKKSCKKIVVAKSSSSSSSVLSATFTLDESRCRIWWIAVVSVFSALTLLVAIAAILVTFNPTVKAKVRPYWARTKQPAVQ